MYPVLEKVFFVKNKYSCLINYLFLFNFTFELNIEIFNIKHKKLLQQIIDRFCHNDPKSRNTNLKQSRPIICRKDNNPGIPHAESIRIVRETDLIFIRSPGNLNHHRSSFQQLAAENTERNANVYTNIFNGIRTPGRMSAFISILL